MALLDILIPESEFLFRGIVVALIVPTVVVSGYYRRRANRWGGAIDGGDGPYRALRLLGSLFAIGLLTYLLAPEWIAWAAVPVPSFVRYGGAVLSAGTIPLFVWVFRSLGGNVTPTSATREDHELVTSGPYRWVRHPLYSAGVAFWTGICLVSANWLLPLLLLPGIVGVALRTPHEERKLIEEFGDEYVAYMQRTGRYVPRVR